MCIGNRNGGDDAIGPYIADKFKEKNGDVIAIDCGIAPENYTAIVKRYMPKNLIIIDAVEMGLHAGEIRIVPKERIGKMHISTHGIPISVLINYLEQYVRNIILIGIQPKRLSGEISEKVKENGDKLIKIIEYNNLKQLKRL